MTTKMTKGDMEMKTTMTMRLVRNGMLMTSMLALTAACSFGPAAGMEHEVEMFGPVAEAQMTTEAPVNEPVSEYDVRVRFVHHLPGVGAANVYVETEDDQMVDLFHRVDEGEASEQMDVVPEISRLVVDSDGLAESLVFDLPTLQAGTASDLILENGPDGMPQLMLHQN